MGRVQHWILSLGPLCLEQGPTHSRHLQKKFVKCVISLRGKRIPTLQANTAPKEGVSALTHLWTTSTRQTPPPGPGLWFHIHELAKALTKMFRELLGSENANLPTNTNVTLKNTLFYLCFLGVSAPSWEACKLVPGY